MDARRISFYVPLLSLPHGDNRQVGSPDEIGKRVEVPVVVLIMHRARARHADEVAREQRRHHVLRRQFHRLLAELEPVEGTHQQIARFRCEGIGLDHAPDAAHRSVHDNTMKRPLCPSREDEEQQQTQLQRQQRSTEAGTYKHLCEEREEIGRAHV